MPSTSAFRLGFKLLLPAFAVLFLVYGASLPGGFVYDDHHFVGNNSAIRTLSDPLRFFYDPSTLSDAPGLNAAGYRPLAVLSYALDYAVAGPRPWYFRAVNIALHCLNTSLVFYLGTLLGLSGLYAGLMSALFALFPGNVESVVWISSRSTVLSTAFILCAVVFFIKYTAEGKIRSMVLSSLFTAAALFTREISVVIPLLAVSYLAAMRIPVRKYLAPVGLYLALPAVLFILLRALLLGGLQQIPPPDLPALSLVSLPFLIFSKYIEILLYPFSMLITYSDLIHLRLHMLWFYFPFALLALALYAVITGALYFRGEKTAVWGLFWLGAAFLPVLNIVSMTFYMAERLTYLPLIGFSMAAAAAARGLDENLRMRKIIFGTLGALFILFALNIQARMAVWRDDVSLWRYDADKNPYNYITRLRLAEALRLADDHPGAFSTLSDTLALELTGAQRAAVFNEMGTLLAMRGDLEEAKRFFQASIALDPYNYLALYNLAKVYSMQGDMAAAGKYLAASLERNKDYPPALELIRSLSAKPRVDI